MEGLSFFAMTSGEMWVYVYTEGLSPGPNHNIQVTVYISSLSAELSQSNYRIILLPSVWLCREPPLKTLFNTSIAGGVALW